MKIKIIFTGGTIGSDVTNNEINVYKKTNKYLVSQFYSKTGLNDVNFDISEPLSTLSENMVIDDWNVIINEIRETDLDCYDGIIIAHGTDTLSYTANMLGIMLYGIDIPVMLVSSNYVLTDERANGIDNFINSVYFIRNYNYKGVYIVYRNTDNVSYVFKGTDIRQCQTLSNNFSTATGRNMIAMKNGEIVLKNELNINNLEKSSINCLYKKIKSLKQCVLCVYPYIGFDYNNIIPTDNIKAILQYTYHSGTACVKKSDNINLSLIEFYNKYKDNVDFYLAPLEKSNKNFYSTTKEIIDSGIMPLFDLCEENAYVKLVIAYSADDLSLRKQIIETDFT